MAKKRRRNLTDAEIARVKRLNLDGYTDDEIAADIGASRACVRFWRRRLHLISNAHSPRAQARRYAAVQEYWRKQELTWQEVGGLRHRIEGAAHGWAGFPATHARVLETLYHGFRSARDLASELGLSTARIRAVLKSLMRSGMVERGSGVYLLTRGADELRTEEGRTARRNRRMD